MVLREVGAGGGRERMVSMVGTVRGGVGCGVAVWVGGGVSGVGGLGREEVWHACGRRVEEVGCAGV